MVDWRVSSVKPCVTEYLRKECSGLNEVALDNGDDKDDDDDDDANSTGVEVVEINTGEAMTMIDMLVNIKSLSKEEINSIAVMKEKLEKIRVLNKKQSHMKEYFMLGQEKPLISRLCD